MKKLFLLTAMVITLASCMHHGVDAHSEASSKEKKSSKM